MVLAFGREIVPSTQTRQPSLSVQVDAEGGPFDELVYFEVVASDIDTHGPAYLCFVKDAQAIAAQRGESCEVVHAKYTEYGELVCGVMLAVHEHWIKPISLGKGRYRKDTELAYIVFACSTGAKINNQMKGNYVIYAVETLTGTTASLSDGESEPRHELSIFKKKMIAKTNYVEDLMSVEWMWLSLFRHLQGVNDNYTAIAQARKKEEEEANSTSSIKAVDECSEAEK
ncbi:hypothetical protein GN244_ATG01945 [Phytophthora infestans]|uniref:Uncharacterized protein n=1 Tax=Phytophthora infestans TaxID=4787 RepID=A0A833TLZ4_PHYIN|nr:hypothetical protein GN244_ATG01945 [Phytophthora infestans]KAF4139895.1 hypothetical protein GN958_ATG10884 [Phytophthora infestans]